MKTELKFLKIPSIVLLILLIITLVNCNDNKCESPDHFEHIYYPLSEDTLLIPYAGNEILKFLKMTPSDTDTVIYQGMGKEYYENIEFNYDAIPCIEKFHYSAYKIVFKNQGSINDENDIEFKLEMFNYKSAEFYIDFLNRSFSDVMRFTISNPWYGGYIGSIDFENQTFYKVSRYTREYQGNDEILYFNNYNGLIRFELKEYVLQLIK